MSVTTKRSKNGKRGEKKEKTKLKPKIQRLVSDDDTDLEYDEDVLLHRIQKDRSDCQKMYEAACRHFQVVISSQFITHMKGTNVHVTDLALGHMDVKAMCIPLLYNNTVTELDLSGNNLGNKGVVHIMDMLKENLHIEELHLARNNISRSGARYICSSLSTNNRHKVLNLSGNLLGDNAANYFAELLRYNSIIKVLDLSSNQFGEQSGEILGAALAENGALEELDLSWNQIRLNGAVALAKALRDNDALRRLDVSWNGFTNEGAAELGHALSENFTLRELNLNCNRINLVGLSHLAKGLHDNDVLDTLKLGGNPILSIGAEMILQVIQQSENSKLATLDLKDIPVSYNFAASVEELQEERTNFTVSHDCKIRYSDDLTRQQQGPLMADPYRLITMYTKERVISLTDMLVSCPECGDMVIDDMPFRAAIQRVNAPLSDIQIEGLARRLYKFDDHNQVVGVDISSLVNPEDYRKKRTIYLSELEKQKERQLAIENALQQQDLHSNDNFQQQDLHSNDNLPPSAVLLGGMGNLRTEATESRSVLMTPTNDDEDIVEFGSDRDGTEGELMAENPVDS